MHYHKLPSVLPNMHAILVDILVLGSYKLPQVYNQTMHAIHVENLVLGTYKLPKDKAILVENLVFGS